MAGTPWLIKEKGKAIQSKDNGTSKQSQMAPLLSNKATTSPSFNSDSGTHNGAKSNSDGIS
jgi:hypothetical protein